MKNKKSKVGLWSALTAITAILTIAAIVGNIIANQYATTINVALNASTYKIIHDSSNTEDTEYFKSDFASDAEREAYEAELCAQVEAEGAALLKNENAALPLAQGAKVSLFGHGSVEGIAAAESANNAVCGATLIPLLTLGIPGDGCVAIMLSALMINGLNPGLSLFTTDGPIMYAIMLGLILVNIFMFLQGRYLTGLFAKVVSIPQQILTPIIVIFCFAGAFSVNSSYFDLGVALVFGILSWVLRKLELPAVPVLLGMVLGNMTETNFRRALLISDGSPKIFFSSVFCWIFIALIVLVIFGILRSKIKESKVQPNKEET